MDEDRSCEDEWCHASLNSIMDALAKELHELWQMIEQLQSSLAPALFTIANDPAKHLDVQSLDLMTQRLLALAKSTAHLGQIFPQEWSLNPYSALRKVTLSDLQCRLKGGERPIGSGLCGGELETF